MPNSINVPTPPMFTGDTENKIKQVHTYLYRLSEQLAMILNSIEAGGSVQVLSGGSVSSSSGDIYAIRDQLKQLIVNTTATLRQEMNDMRDGLLETISATTSQLDTELRDLVAESDEALRQEIENRIAAVTTIIDALEDALVARLDDHDTAIAALENGISDIEKDVDGLAADLDKANDAIGKIKLDSLGVRSGTAMCTNALAGGQHEDISVSFDALPAAPVVVASLIGTGADGEFGGNVSCQVLTGSITASSFLVRVACSSGQETAYSYGVSWIAVAGGE